MAINWDKAKQSAQEKDKASGLGGMPYTETYTMQKSTPLSFDPAVATAQRDYQKHMQKLYSTPDALARLQYAMSGMPLPAGYYVTQKQVEDKERTKAEKWAELEAARKAQIFKNDTTSNPYTDEVSVLPEEVTVTQKESEYDAAATGYEWYRKQFANAGQKYVPLADQNMNALQRAMYAGQSAIQSAASGTLGAAEVVYKSQLESALSALGYYSNPDYAEFREYIDQQGGVYDALLPGIKDIPSNIRAKSQESMQKATEGASNVGQFALEGFSSIVNLGANAGVSALSGIPLPVLMGIQGGGNAALDAKAQGATLDQQLLLGSTIGAATGLIESIGGIGASKVAKAAAGKVVGGLMASLPAQIVKWMNTGGAKVAGKILGNAMSEGFEEFTQYGVEVFLQNLILDEDVPYDIKDAARNTLLGGTIGGLFGAGTYGANSTPTQTPSAPTQTQTPVAPSTTTQTAQSAPQAVQQAAGATLTPTATQGAPQANAPQNVAQTLLNAQQTQQAMGAADVGFNPFSNLQNQKSQFFPEGEKAARQVDVPTTDANGMNISKTAATVMEAEATPDAAVPAIEQAVTQGNFSYMKITDDAAKTRATATITSKGYETALRDWTAEVRKGSVSKDLVATGAALYNAAVNAGDMKTAVDILTDYTTTIRNGAQATQAARLLKQLSPEYQLYSVQRSVQNLTDELITKYGDKAPNIQIDPTLAQEYLDALTSKDAKRIKTAEKALYKSIADQIPSTFADKWNAWRYLSMLGNFRTHIRNIMGNTVFVPIRTTKNVISAALQRIVLAQSNRTTSILTLSSADRARMRIGLSDYATVQEDVLSGGKFNDVRNKIESEKTAFKSDIPVVKTLMSGMNAASNASTSLLNMEDNWFAMPAYASSLASYLKAQGFTAADFTSGKMTPEQIDSARAWAIKEAQKATYRDFNDFSNWVARLGRGYTGNNKAARAANVLIEGVLPFKRTPANILARGVEYSPVGLLKGLTYDLAQVKKGNISPAEVVDNIAAGLTGTALVGLGLWAASSGLVRASAPGDEKEKALDQLRGYQDYAIQIGNQSITLDWLAPGAIPFFIGVEMWSANEGDEAVTFKSILNAAMKISDPLLETSMLQSINDLIDSAAYSEDGMFRYISTLAFSYISQALPTLAGQIERVTEETRQSTYIDPNSPFPASMQIMLGKAANKIPGVEYNQREYTDAFGRTQSTGTLTERLFNNLVNPAYVSDITETPVDQEIERLYGTGDLSTIPTQPDKNFTYNKTRYDLTKDEYTQYSITRGQLILDSLQALISSDAYKAFSDVDKAKYVQQLIDFSSDRAKAQIVESRGEKYEPSSFKDLIAAQDAGISFGEYFRAYSLNKQIDESDGSASYKANQFSAEIDKQFTNLTRAQRTVLKDTMKYMSIIPQDASATDKLEYAGLNNDTAFKVYDIVSGIAPLPGKESPTSLQIYSAVATADLSDTQKMQALSVYMSESAYDNLKSATNSGVPVDDYVSFLNDIDGISGDDRKAQIMDVIDSLDITAEQKDALYFAAGYKESTLYKDAPWY